MLPLTREVAVCMHDSYYIKFIYEWMFVPDVMRFSADLSGIWLLVVSRMGNT